MSYWKKETEVVCAWLSALDEQFEYRPEQKDARYGYAINRYRPGASGFIPATANRSTWKDLYIEAQRLLIARLDWTCRHYAHIIAEATDQPVPEVWS